MHIHSQNSFFCLLLISVSLHSITGHAAGYQSLADIQYVAESHVRKLLPGNAGVIHLTATQLDSRLRLEQCATDLQAFLPSGANLGNRATVGVRCDTGNTWSVYVPVNIETEIKVFSLNKPLSRNATITTADVDGRTQRVPGLSNQYLTKVSELQDQRLKRDLSAGTLLTASMVQPQLVIRRGQQVTILAKVAGIEVRNQGVALADGEADSRVRVKNLSSSKVVEGVVDSMGLVRITL
ncbi:MAG: flagellar basal body P-ring formation chaperone FlgA [Steroidobacteraceae bacterium]